MLLPGIVVSAAAILSCAARADVEYDPSANPKSVVRVDMQARFTILTAQLIRMEWGGNRDEATLAFVNRNLPPPEYSVSKDGEWTVIKTAMVTVHYLPNNITFGASNLKVSVIVDGSPVSWSPTPGIHDINSNQRMPGTIRGLDRVDGRAELNCYDQTDPDLYCELGVIAKSGYVVVDDSNRPAIDDSDWPWVVNGTSVPPDPAACQIIPPEEREDCGYLNIAEFDCSANSVCCYDNSTASDIPSCYYTTNSYKDLYFFGHGHDYKQALKEFTMVSGHIPIPPRYAFGVYYSRYHAYNDVGVMEIISEFEEHKVPLDMLVLDMDWHITFYDGSKDSAGQNKGWTGFTWDKHLFPDPKDFLARVRRDGLKVTLNVHSASGIQYWEDTYEAMATSMGVDPKTKEAISFVPADKKFVSNWCQIVLKKREAEGVNFWWLDWGQGRRDWIEISRMNPIYWQNYIFYTDPYHWNDTSRPLIMHRWGGLGNHRYQIGFSGDVIWSWESLAFQVYFTLSASNVGHGYWSHDIGGHLGQKSSNVLDGELYTRWVQWGAFSPIFRPHTNKNGKYFRRIWKYPDVFYEPMRTAILLRQSLIPYIYNAAHTAYTEGLSLIRPMYYEFPLDEKAYTYQGQYYFGGDILVSPIAEPVNNYILVTAKKIWIPKGCYVSWWSGELFFGDQVIERNFTLEEIPVFVKCGAIIPMTVDIYNAKYLGSAQKIPKVIKLMLFHGNNKSGQVELYEDDGNSTLYQQGKYASTNIGFFNDKQRHTFSMSINPVTGDGFAGQQLNRCYQICIVNFSPATAVIVIEERRELPYLPLQNHFDEYDIDSWTYDGSRQQLIINLVTERPVSKLIALEIDYSSFSGYDPFWLQAGFVGKLLRLQKAKQILDAQWNTDTVHQADYPNLLNASVIGRAITYHPSDILNLTQSFNSSIKLIADEVNGLKVYETVKQSVMALIN